MLPAILKKADKLIITQFKSSMDWGVNLGMDTASVKKQMTNAKKLNTNVIYENDVKRALNKAIDYQRELGKKSLIVVTGSLYLVGEVRSLLFFKKYKGEN